MDLNITTEQFKEAIIKQYQPSINDLKSDEQMRKMVREFGCNPDEIAAEIEADFEAEMNRATEKENENLNNTILMMTGQLQESRRQTDACKEVIRKQALEIETLRKIVSPI